MTELPASRDSPLFTPLKVGGKHIKNRIALTAHGDRFAAEGIVTEQLIAHYERRAAGGVGLIVALGSAPVHGGFSGGSNPALVSLWSSDNDSPLLRMSERIHQHGAVLLGQATHRGQRERPSGHNPILVAPSSWPGSPPGGSAAALERDEIDELVRAYATAAQRLEQCGFDGIQVTASPSHLIENFWSPVLNRRTDRYGGSPQNRLRFGLQVLDAINAVVSTSFIVSFRMSADLLTDDLGLTKESLLEIAIKMDEQCRIDLFDITGGSGLDAATHAGAVPTDDFPIGCYNALAGRIRHDVTSPVLVAGRVLDISSAESALRAGDCDLVGMTRALIADPGLVARARAGELRRIRPCIGINEGCRRVIAGHQLACTVNSEVGNASHAEPYRPTAVKRSVVVVGGGPGGMEAARVTRERGHYVLLIDRESALGGQMCIAAQSRSRPHLGRHVVWLQSEIRRLAVDVRLGVAADGAMIRELDPDALIIGTGARSYLPGAIRGLDRAVATDLDVIAGRVPVLAGSNVTVYDAEGYHRGVNVAVLAAGAGAKVELITPFPSPADHLESPNRRAMYRAVTSAPISVLTSQRLQGTAHGRLVTRDVWTNELRQHGAADLYVFVGFYESNRELFSTVARELPNLKTHLIGDARAPRLLRHAIFEGVEAGIMV